MMVFTVDLPPSANRLYRNVPGKGRAKTKEYRSYQTRTIGDIQKQLTRANRKGWPDGEELALDLWVYLKNNRVTDADNRAKAVQDTLAKALGFQDRHVFDVCSHKRVERSLPREICVVRFARSTMARGPLEIARAC